MDISHFLTVDAFYFMNQSNAMQANKQRIDKENAIVTEPS